MIDDDIVGNAGKAVLAWFALKGLGRLLGPTADLYGERLRDLADAGNRNLHTIFARAIEKAGDDLDQDGQISPRLLTHLVEGAPYCEDAIAQDYFAGIIASSRTKDGSDHLIHHSALINRLPTSQIRLHYFFYTMFFKCYKYSGLAMNKDQDRLKMPIFIPLDILVYFIIAAFKFGGRSDVESMLAYHDDAINNLYDENLIGTHVYGNKIYFDKEFPNFKFGEGFSGGLIVTPSTRGAELFLRARGFKDKILGQFFQADLKKAIVNWFDVDSQRANKMLKYTVRFMKNELTIQEPDFELESKISFDRDQIFEIVKERKTGRI